MLDTDEEIESLHKGIAERNFTRTSPKLADYVEVKDAQVRRWYPKINCLEMFRGNEAQENQYFNVNGVGSKVCLINPNPINTTMPNQSEVVHKVILKYPIGLK